MTMLRWGWEGVCKKTLLLHAALAPSTTHLETIPAPAANRFKKCFMIASALPSPRQFSTNLSRDLRRQEGSQQPTGFE